MSPDGGEGRGRGGVGAEITSFTICAKGLDPTVVGTPRAYCDPSFVPPVLFVRCNFPVVRKVV